MATFVRNNACNLMVLFGEVIILWQGYTKSENRNTKVERSRMRELNMKISYV